LTRNLSPFGGGLRGRSGFAGVGINKAKRIFLPLPPPKGDILWVVPPEGDKYKFL